MSILTEPLPDYVVVRGEKYRVNTDFRVWLKFTSLAFEKFTNAQKAFEIIALVYERIPSNLIDGLKALLEFYNLNREREEINEGKSVSVRAYDFEHDASSIYAAFRQQYGIDLLNDNLHWWEFRALLDNLTEDTAFIKTVQYRNMDLSEIKSDELRKHYAKMKHRCRLPEKRTEAEIEEEFNKQFSGMFI